MQFTVAQKAKPDVLEALGTTAIPESIMVDGVKVATDVLERKFAAEYKLVPEAAAGQRNPRIDPIVPGVAFRTHVARPARSAASFMTTPTALLTC